MASIFLFLVLCLPSLALSNKPTFERLILPSNAIGPESIAFDRSGKGPYTGISDGRIIKYEGPKYGFVDFAVTVPNRPKRECDGNRESARGRICGRALGLAFDTKSKQLYIIDAYRGLHVVSSAGGLATVVTFTEPEPVPSHYYNGVDVGQKTGVVYFTDASAKYPFEQTVVAIADRGDATGRVLRYDPGSGQVTVLLDRLLFAADVEASVDESYLLVTETAASRIRKYWLRGPRAGTSEIIVQFPDLSQPANIENAGSRTYWIAVNLFNGTVPVAIKINEDGRELKRINLNQQYQDIAITEFQIYKGEGYVGSLLADYVGVLADPLDA